MLNIALAGLESAMNAALRLDPETIERLAKLENKIIGITITDWDITFTVTPQCDGVALSVKSEQPADTTISGTLMGLFHVGRAKGRGDALFKHKINFNGDIAVGESIRDVMAAVDIDWEEHLSRLVGDIAAHRLGQGVRRAQRFGKQLTSSFSDNLKEFFQQEIALVPTREEVEQFVETVQLLQQDMDRVEARFNRLLAKRGGSS